MDQMFDRAKSFRYQLDNWKINKNCRRNLMIKNKCYEEEPKILAQWTGRNNYLQSKLKIDEKESVKKLVKIYTNTENNYCGKVFFGENPMRKFTTK
jgi:hypothetical protein